MLNSRLRIKSWGVFGLYLGSLILFFGCGIAPTAPLAAFGDSVTFGYGGLPGGWVNALELKSGYSISDLGVPGEKSGAGAARISDALTIVPGTKVVLILHGGNDWVGIFRGGECNSGCDPSATEDAYVAVGRRLADMATEAQRQGRRVVFATYWPSSPVACGNYTPEHFALYQAHLARLNAETVRVAAACNTEVVRLDDLSAIATDPTNFFDCLHPARKGYEMIADRWLQDAAKWEP